MRIMKFNRKNYTQRVFFIPETKTIFKIDCTCRDFEQRRIKPIGDFADKKYKAECCKHLRDIINLYKECGFKLKEHELTGPKKLTKEVKNKIITRSQGMCENPICQNEAKCFHRKIRGSNGGKYTESNVVHICEDCHKQIHSNEFIGAKSK